ncbi:MAG: AAA family ATPase [Syntrophobacterales bacterium]|nr:AAA family ATPase [Syntrophobacterales bacterium]
MKKLPKEILNYFATFTETRFNFRRLINYKWTNNELTLDLSLFPTFQTRLLQKIKTGDLSPVTIKQNEYTIVISKEVLQLDVEALLQNKVNKSYLDKCLTDEYALIAQNKAFIADQRCEIVPEEDDPAGHELLTRQKSLALKEGLRTYNLALRREFEKTLNKLHEKVVEQKKDELNIEHVPSSIFGGTNYVNQKFEQIKAIGNNFTDSNSYIQSLLEYFRKSIDDIVIYDLYYNLQKYADFTKLGTLYLFFHMLVDNGEAYPLYFIEVEYRTSSSEVTLSFPRNLMLLNTPAINYFKYDSVLTIPRASSITAMNAYLGAMETFIQTQYGFQTPFITEPSFNRITHVDNKFPAIKNRIGFQTIMNEDKKLLDYSELMTKTEMNPEGKFSDFIDQYVRGSVPNHQEEVDRKFLEKYSIKNPARYISNSPLPLNNSQKRILLALANEKNHVIVVDGPPGTGKSHTIAALTYWANENNKSVVITSHKQEALDVIDRMLTDKYKSLHPQAKPSIVRMDKETGSANNLPNTLATSVLGAASTRALDYNKEANQTDAKRQSERLIRKIEDKLAQSGCYEETIQKIIQFDDVDQKLATDVQLASILSAIKPPGQKTDFTVIQEFLDSGILPKLSFASLEEYAYLLEQKENIPAFLEACERLHRVPEADLRMETALAEIPPSFSELLADLQAHFKDDIQLSEITTKHATAGFFKKLLGKAPKDETLKAMLAELSSLQFANVVAEIARILKREKESITIRDLVEGVEKIRFVISIKKYKDLLESYRALPGNPDKSIGDIYEAFRKLDEFKDLLTLALYQALQSSFKNYGPLLTHFGITEKSLKGLAKLKGLDEKTKHAWQWMQLHYFLSGQARLSALHLTDFDSYCRLKQKEIENLNDQRLKNLNNHLGEMARIKVSYEGGKRFTAAEAKVLLGGISCIIAEPGTISRHFPMEEGLIDVLIIDEASQVSIADSISLILRAKQVVIFGDEYQYGAVSATNVNARYSASYFSKIISAFADDYNTTVTAAAEKELVDEVSRKISADDQMIDIPLKPEPGKILWLKTFDIRTSTLTFAKAIANYTTSLKEHFRSFPEIISYSNDHFYKEAQMELIVNRIRTKPIGEVLQFIHVETQGKAGPNTNLDEIETIANDIQKRLKEGFKGTIGVITSFREQQARMEQSLNERFNMAALRRDHKLAIWFVGDVQGEERDIVYYSFVEGKNINNANLATIYPVLQGTADSIRSLKMQRLNVGFSRAKDTMIFVMSQPLENFSNTRLGDALKHYASTLEQNKKNDFFIENEAVFESPMEKKLYALLLETPFVQERREHIKIIPQFDIGKYIAAEYNASIPKYRADFLLTYAKGGKEETLILEYDGLEYHFQNPRDVNNLNFSQSYLDYDTQRQMELESYGYRFLRINKFNLRPQMPGQTEVDVLDQLLKESFTSH